MSAARQKWIRRAGIALFAVGLFVGLRAWHTRSTAQGAAPPIEAADIHGEVISLAAMQGQPALIHFWATWCGTCKMMDHSVESVARDHQVITVASQSGLDRHLQGFLEQHGLDLPVIADPQGALARRFGVTAFPTTFFVDEHGNIDHTEVGFSTETGLRTRLWLAGL